MCALGICLQASWSRVTNTNLGEMFAAKGRIKGRGGEGALDNLIVVDWQRHLFIINQIKLEPAGRVKPISQMNSKWLPRGHIRPRTRVPSQDFSSLHFTVTHIRERVVVDLSFSYPLLTLLNRPFTRLVSIFPPSNSLRIVG